MHIFMPCGVIKLDIPERKARREHTEKVWEALREGAVSLDNIVGNRN